MANLTQEHLKKVLRYDPDSGLFWRLMPISRRNPLPRPDQQSGFPDRKGYIRVGIGGGRHYAAHRLAWLYMTGAWPSHQIDHRDANKANNSWTNLRAANQSENQCNVGPKRTNRVGLKGAHYQSGMGCWTSRIRKDGKRHFLGLFKTPEEAHAAYCRAASDLHGEFARVS